MGLHITSEIRVVLEQEICQPEFHLLIPRGGNKGPFLGRVRKALSGGTLALMLICPNAFFGSSGQSAKQRHPTTSAHRIDPGQSVVLAHPEFQVFEEFPAQIKCGNVDLRISVDDPRYYTGEPYREKIVGKIYSASQDKSDLFYGVERIVHYAISKEQAPVGNVLVQERVTVLFDNTNRFDPKKPAVIESEPFVVSEDGTFLDRQTLGSYGSSPDVRVVQLLRQEILMSGKLTITIYILRTPRDIRLIGYSIPQ